MDAAAARAQSLAAAAAAAAPAYCIITSSSTSHISAASNAYTVVGRSVRNDFEMLFKLNVTRTHTPYEPTRTFISRVCVQVTNLDLVLSSVLTYECTDVIRLSVLTSARIHFSSYFY